MADDVWPELVEAAGFEQMRARADMIAPNVAGVFKHVDRFFLRGSSRAGQAVLTGDELDRYRARAEQLSSADLLAWLHHVAIG